MRESVPPLVSWLRLLRAPNLFTVPGDTLAGFFLAGGSISCWGSAFFPGLAVLFLYSVGVLTNDLVDVREDAAERPSRPLVAGQVTRGHIECAAVFAAVAGLLCCLAAGPDVLVAGIVLLTLVLLYNYRAKRHVLTGPLVMGLCRAGSVFLGAVAVAGEEFGNPLVLAGAATVGVYVVSISIAARNETCGVRAGPWRWIPPVGAAAAALLFFGVTGPVGTTAAALLVIAAIHALIVAVIMPRAGVPEAVGYWIRGLVFFQAALVLSAPQTGTANIVVTAVLVAMWLPSAVMGRSIQAS